MVNSRVRLDHYIKKQVNKEATFFNSDLVKVTILTEEDVEHLKQNTGIVRNRLKIQFIIKTANAY
jgi:DNA-3-methyladenine glycosylase I